jgi:hypothetical protein
MRRTLYLAVTVVAWLAALLLLVSALIGVVQLAGGQISRSSGGVGGEIAAVVLLTLGVLVLGRLGLAAEHRFRGVPGGRHGQREGGTSPLDLRPNADSVDAFGRPMAPAAAVAPSAAAARSGRAARRVSGHRARHPIGSAIAVALAIGGLAVLPVEAIVGISAHLRSQETQHHGVRVPVFVGRVTNTQHCGRGGCYYTFAASAELARPFHGHSTTTLHGQGTLRRGVGVAIALLDPNEPAYAELPGDPLADATDWAVPLGLIGLIAGTVTFSVAHSRRRRTRRRALGHTAGQR